MTAREIYPEAYGDIDLCFELVDLPIARSERMQQDVFEGRVSPYPRAPSATPANRPPTADLVLYVC
jgi:hypothetical protein